MAKLTIEEQLTAEDHLSKERDYINTLRQGYQRDLAEIFKQIVILSVAVVGFNLVVNTIDQLEWKPEPIMWLASNVCLVSAVSLTLLFYFWNASIQTLEVERILDGQGQNEEVETLRERINKLQFWVFLLFAAGIVLTFLMTVYRLS